MQPFHQLILSAILALLILTPSVEAKMTAGDVIALILGLVLGILGICACLGYYARSRQ
eukprot:gene317-3686_t